MKMSVRSASSSAERVAKVCIAGAVQGTDTDYVAPSAAVQEHTIDCSTAKAGDEITIYSQSSGIYVFDIEWIPAAAAEPVAFEWGNTFLLHSWPNMAAV